MSGDNWRRVKELHAELLELSDRERRLRLDELRAEEPDLAVEVERLLVASDDVTVGFLEAPDLLTEPPELPGVPGSLGPSTLGNLETVLDDFELIEEIGRGGMGVVFRARQVSLEREVAVKVLPLSVTLDERKVERFQREARSAAKLSHPSIVPIFAVGVDAGTHYFAMELVPGHDLHRELDLLRHGETAGTTLPLPDSHEYIARAVEAIADVADALELAHSNGIVHRDVKPQNLLISVDGRLQLVDFGLARDESLGSLSRTGEVEGTPYYMSPEQAQAIQHKIDHRTDVYSLGVVLYEVLTLRRPFEGRTSQEVITKIAEREPVPVHRLNKRVPNDLEVICSKAISKRPEDRYFTAGDFAADLRRFLNHEAIVAKPPSLPRRLRRKLVRHHKAVIAAMILAVALVSGFRIAEARSARDFVRQRVEALQKLDEEPDWRSIPVPQLSSARQMTAELGVWSDRVSDEELALVDHIDDRFAELREEMRQEGKQAYQAGVEGEGSQADEDMWVGLMTLRNAAALFPEDEELATLALIQSIYPRISVQALSPDGSPLRGTVSVRRVDMASGDVGPKEPLGSLPLVEHNLRAGYMRIMVEFEGGGFRELLRYLQPGPRHYSLTASLRTDESTITRGMILIPAGRLSLPRGPGYSCVNEGRDVDVEAFFIDECEVSNGEYAEYLAATGRPEPVDWQWWTDREQGRDLPVGGILWGEARDYAEWAGKRLVSHAEFEFAARGPEGRLYPWGDDPTDLLTRANIGSTGDPGRSVEEFFRDYFQNAMPVRSMPAGRTPEGVYHLYGNVSEMTESMHSVLTSEEWVAARTMRTVLGGFYGTHKSEGPDQGGLRYYAIMGLDERWRSPHRGFRCAKSVAP